MPRQFEAWLPEDRLRVALTAARMVAFEYDPAGGEVIVSDNAAEVFGLPAGSTLHHSEQVFALVHPDDVARHRATLTTAVDECRSYASHYRMIRPDTGEVIWLEEQGQCIGDDTGETLRIVGVVADVTQRKRGELQLAAELGVAQQLQQVSTALLQGGDDESIYERIMDAAMAVMRSDFASMQMLYPERGEPGGAGELKLLASRGFSPEAARFWEWVRADSKCGCGRALSTGERCVITDFETCQWMAGTEELTAYRAADIKAMQSTPLISRSGRTLGMISTHWRQPHEPSQHDLRLLDVLARQAADLIERRQAEDALRESAAQFRTLADNMSQLAWMADAKGWIYWYNQRWYDYTGTTLEEMQGWGWKKVHHPDHVDRVVTRVQHSWDTGEVWEDTFPLRSKEDEYRWYLSRAVPIRDEHGKVLRWFGTNTDVTERRAAEEALRNADRRKDEFLATLAHELRNPLAPLRHGLQIMELAGDDGATVEQTRTMMERQLNQLVRLVDDLLDVSRISRGKLALRREQIELAAVLENAVETSRPVIEAAGVELSISVSHEPLYVDGDTTRLAQVFANLLNNAAKYSERGRRIQLAAQRQGSDVVVSVKDEGVGIPRAMLSTIFDLFTQVDRSLERSQGGLGIGLTLVKRLVQMHGGSVEARSEGRGRGSEFVVRLPAELPETKTAAPRGDDETANESRRCRVLVADDNADSARSLALMLKMMGNEVCTANDGQQAVDASERFQPDVVLLDIGMPKLNGYEACRRIREHPWGEKLTLVALTGWGQDEDKRRSLEAGFDHHLVKPVDRAALGALLALPKASD
jgi:PAS domain S-box-containing protein